MRILVTGGAGYIGSHAVRRFLEHGDEAWAYDNLVYGHAEAVPADRLVVGDLGDSSHLMQILRGKKIDAVVHFAAFCYVGESMTAPQKYYENNVANTLKLLDAMRRCQVNSIVFSSSCATYGIPTQTPVTEDEPQRPINPYGRAKLVVEWALADYALAYGLAYASLRYFNAAGASPAGDIGEDHEPETHLIPLALQVATGRRPHIEVFGSDYPTPDGTCIRDYVHVDDLADAHLFALQKLQPSMGLLYNLGTGRGNSVREVVQTCEAITGVRIPVKIAPRRPGDPPSLVASAEKAQRELGWRPRFPDLHSIVETAWRWHQAHPGGYGTRKK